MTATTIPAIPYAAVAPREADQLMHEQQVALDDLLLDPNNYRFQDESPFRQVPEPRFAEDGVQANALKRLDSQGLSELKASIQHNGFLSVEKVVVRPWISNGQKYVVVEGNRRVAALKRLRDDHKAGIEVNPSVQAIFDAIPVLAMNAGEPVDYLAVMGIRHVSGVRRWGPYQSAKLIGELRDSHELDFTEIGQRLALATREVTRRYRAIKALEQMESDEEFGEAARRSMYPLFHEAVSQPVVRDWLGWNDKSFVFEDRDNRTWFYELLSPPDNEDEEDASSPKITTSAQVRVLKSILASDEASAALKDPDKTFDEAIGLAVAKELIEKWPTELAEAIRALESIPALALSSLAADRLGLIEKIRDKANELLETHAKLTS